MQEPVLRVFGDGLRVLETMQDLAGMDANQDWMQGSKWTLIDGSVITVNGSHVDITD